jgi:hypothetical protein
MIELFVVLVELFKNRFLLSMYIIVINVMVLCKKYLFFLEVLDKSGFFIVKKVIVGAKIIGFGLSFTIHPL